MRQSWTDDRLDDLSHRMDERFDRVEGEMNAGFARVDGEMHAGFARIDGEMKAGFARIDGEFKDLRAEMTAGHDALRKELRQEIAGCEARLRTQMSEHYVRTGEAIAALHDDNRQIHAEMHALHRTIIRIAAGTAGTVVLTVLAALITGS